MGKLIDFNKYKGDKESGDVLENKYLKFLTYVNKFTGTPTTGDKLAEILYYNLRYLEGTVNGMSMMSFLNVMTRKEIEEGKRLIIGWLNQIIEDVKNI